MQVSAPRAISLDGDARRLQTAFSSLCQAALGSAADGSLTVEVTDSGDRAVVRISHRPGGFAPPRQGVLFDPFAGTGGPGRSHAGPVALLAARRVIEAHGGVVWPESGEDEVVFHVELPRPAERTRRFAS